MAKRLPSPNRVKGNRVYTIHEASLAIGVHKNTIARWIKGDCLEATTDRRPFLISGSSLKRFLADRRGRNRTSCGPDEFYCFRCRLPRRPAGKWAEYEARTDRSGNLTALCEDCETVMNKAASLAKLPDLRRFMEITERGVV